MLSKLWENNLRKLTDLCCYKMVIARLKFILLSHTRKTMKPPLSPSQVVFYIALLEQISE